jgi:S-formylglutathione hydrolase FrmB
MPEAGPFGWYSDWWNHGAGGPPAWETFHLRELRRLLERDYGAGHRRVVAGLVDFGEDPLALWGDPVAQRRIWEAHDPYFLVRRLRHTPVFLSVGDGSAGPFDPPGVVDELEAEPPRRPQ